MSASILGISAYYHDSAAALLINGEIIAAAQEERFTREKHDSSFPVNAVKYVLNEGGVLLDDLVAVAFYDKPYLKFERLAETYHAFAPRGLKSFLTAMPVWIKEKLFMQKIIRDELGSLALGKVKRLLFPEHHLSHAASAFFPSPFAEAAIVTIDGVGEWATTMISYGNQNQIKVLRELDFPHSLGLLYTAFTYYCGFKVNGGEYKLMGLAPYGSSYPGQARKFEQLILEELVDLRADGSFLLNMDYFNFATGLTMCCEEKWEKLFGFPRRMPESRISPEVTSLALAIQKVTEEIVIRLADTAKLLTGSKNLAMAGGVALNAVANGKLLKKAIFDHLWVQPAAGDAGGALGAALVAWHIWKNQDRKVILAPDSMKGAYLGPQYSDLEIEWLLTKVGAPFVKYEDFDQLCDEVADLLAAGRVIGWFQGRMEFGPRALGNRSILADPRQPEMQKRLNLKIKYREGFRPFAPSVLEEDLGRYFDLDRPSPYMLLVAPVRSDIRNPDINKPENADPLQTLYHCRSDIPAVTHIDYSARIQSVSREINERFYKVINAFKTKTGCGLLVNTSFNIRGEPIVCTPLDAYQCFMRTEMDYLVMGSYLLNKNEQLAFKERGDWYAPFGSD